jgi:hypothetical protein
MKRLIILIMGLHLCFLMYGINPFLPPYAFIPDGEPHVFKVGDEERLFIYGSRDETTISFCGTGHDLWSAPVNDLTKWKFHGEIFNVKQVAEIGYGKVPKQHFGAPDCVYNPVTKKYYLYTFLGTPYKLDGIEGPRKDSVNLSETFGQFGPKCVMAKSDSPYGPFTNPIMCDWEVDNSAGTFDPSVIVINLPDNSVRVFAYWGMKKGDRWAEIDAADMHTVINGSTRKPDRKATYKTLNNPTLNNYKTLFEASSIKQVSNDLFVFVFSPNYKASALSYCYGNSPEGPWKWGGEIVNNSTNWKFGNNHGSIVKVGNQWYVVYHRAAPNNFNRQAMIEPIDLRIEGDKVIIPEVSMTSQGILKDGLPIYQRYYAGIVCHLEGSASVDGKRRLENGYNPVVVEPAGAVLGYKYFNFGTNALQKLTFILNANAATDFSIKLEVMPLNGKKRILIAQQTFSPTRKQKNVFVDYCINIQRLEQNVDLQLAGGLSGSMAMYITLKSANNMEIKELEFKNK